MFEVAKRELSYADHLYRVTLPIVKDKHVYSNILDHLYNAFVYSIKEFLKYQKLKRKISLLPSTDELSISLFKERFGDKIVDKKLFKEFELVMNAHKDKYDEMIKEGELVVMLKDFKIIRINREDIAKYISLINNIINRLEGEING